MIVPYKLQQPFTQVSEYNDSWVSIQPRQSQEPAPTIYHPFQTQRQIPVIRLNVAREWNLSNTKYEIGEAIYPLRITRISSNTESPE